MNTNQHQNLNESISQVVNEISPQMKARALGARQERVRNNPTVKGQWQQAKNTERLRKAIKGKSAAEQEGFRYWKNRGTERERNKEFTRQHDAGQDRMRDLLKGMMNK